MSFLRLRSMLPTIPTKVSAFSEGYYVNTYGWLNDMAWANNEININNI